MAVGVIHSGAGRISSAEVRLDECGHCFVIEPKATLNRCPTSVCRITSRAIHFVQQTTWCKFACVLKSPNGKPTQALNNLSKTSSSLCWTERFDELLSAFFVATHQGERIIKTIATALLIAAFTAQLAQAQPVTSSIIDGKVAVNVEGTVAMSGLNLKSAGGYFVPIPPGTTDASATPFTFLLANNANNVSYAAIPGVNVDITGLLITDIGYTRDNSIARTDMASSAYLSAPFGGVSFPTGVVLPEPSSGILGATVCVCLLGFRRRRSSMGFSRGMKCV